MSFLASLAAGSKYGQAGAGGAPIGEGMAPTGDALVSEGMAPTGGPAASAPGGISAMLLNAGGIKEPETASPFMKGLGYIAGTAATAHSLRKGLQQNLEDRGNDLANNLLNSLFTPRR